MKREAGFTLMELMIVIIIIGVLAAIAIPSFNVYIKRSRASEATTFLGEIRQRQESYRSEFGQYCAVSGTTYAAMLPNPVPRAVPNSQPFSWNPMAANWDQLGAAPDGPVRFVYSTVAGTPMTAPAGLNYAQTDFWFVAQAVGDLDDDMTFVTFEAYSAASHIWSSEVAGWE